LSAWELTSIAVAAASLWATAYLGVLALLSARPRPPAPPEPKTRFAFVVPAHDEETGIAQTVGSALAADWPATLREVVVVADNCTDATAQAARDAGARVIERTDDERRGKGYALELAFETLLEEGGVDAIVVIDADTLVSENLLAAFAARLARGESAAQAEYGVSNVDASWRTRLMTVALAMFHGVRSTARERLGVSVGLRGNGMCFSAQLLRDHPHEAYGLVEDVEYGIALGLAGHRVAYAGEATVRGEMVSTGGAAASQRRRWEGGRAQLVRAHLGDLLRESLRRRSLMLLDLAMDLIVPPLSYLGLLAGLALVVEGARLVLGGAPGVATALAAATAAGLLLYVLRGVMLSGLGFGAVTALLWAPVYVAWKVVRVRPWRADDTWVRTRREAEDNNADDGEDAGGTA
jgi:cellulose synthase/poly-beta-1,6-N-acetylglucosamine synthase-like glycosyltransferase